MVSLYVKLQWNFINEWQKRSLLQFQQVFKWQVQIEHDYDELKNSIYLCQFGRIIPQIYCCCHCSVVVQSCSTLWFHELQHAKLPCPSLSHRVSSNSCTLSWWCYLSISFSVCPLFLLPSIILSITVFSNELTRGIR